MARGAGVAEAPAGIALAKGALYWVDPPAGTVVRVSDTDGTPEVLVTGADQPTSIAAGEGRVVWTARDGVWACPPDDCEAQKKLLAPSVAPGSLREVAYDGTTVFWTDRGSAEDATDGRVMRCSPDDCRPQQISGLQMAPAGISLFDDTIYWTYQGDSFPSGHVYYSLKLGDDSNDLAAGLVLPTGIATDSIRVYFTQWTSAGKVLWCPRSRGFCMEPADVAAAAGPLGHPRDVAVAGARVYFSTQDDGAIRSCPVPACAADEAPRLHATGRPGLNRMVVGTSCVLFTDADGGGSVMKVAR